MSQVREVYSAQSPDELALVNAAKYFGMKFKSRPSKNMLVIEQDLPVNPVRGGPSSSYNPGLQLLQYDLLEIIEFSSARKRMSVIVRDQQRGVIKVLTKGADSILANLIRQVYTSTV